MFVFIYILGFLYEEYHIICEECCWLFLLFYFNQLKSIKMLFLFRTNQNEKQIIVIPDHGTLFTIFSYTVYFP